MFFAGVAVTLGTMLLVAFVFWIRRRNHLISKSPTGINAAHTVVDIRTNPAIEASMVTVLTEPVAEAQPQNNQVCSSVVLNAQRLTINESTFYGYGTPFWQEFKLTCRKFPCGLCKVEKYLFKKAS